MEPVSSYLIAHKQQNEDGQLFDIDPLLHQPLICMHLDALGGLTYADI